MKERYATVFIVDDDEAVRTSLRLLLKSVDISATAVGSAQEFLASHDPSQPGCLLLDIRMPGMSGLELQQKLNLRRAIIPVIFMTGHGDVPMAVEAMKHGAFDFLQKPFRDQELLDHVQRAMAKDRDNRVLLSQQWSIQVRLESLTPREREVLDLMTRGKSNKVMAADLAISQRTVEIHRARVMDKMGAPSLAQVVRMMTDLKHAVAADR